MSLVVNSKILNNCFTVFLSGSVDSSNAMQMESEISRACAIPFVIVVLPAAKVPCMAITSPFFNLFPIRFPSSIVSSAEEVVNVNKVFFLLTLQ